VKTKIFNLVIALVVLVISIIVIIPLPDIVPTHFDIHGVADAWGSKWTLIMTPIIMIAMSLFWFGVDKSYDKLISSEDEKVRAEAIANRRVINITSIATSFIFVAVSFFTFYSSISQIEGGDVREIDILKWIAVVMGISFAFLGNIMPKSRNNPNVGFRLPWTMYNDVTWYKCNRVGGISMMVSGVVIALSGLILSGTSAMIAFMAVVTLNILFLTVYAYLVYRKERANEKES
jgi:uncharacterized membrane protein